MCLFRWVGPQSRPFFYQVFQGIIVGGISLRYFTYLFYAKVFRFYLRFVSDPAGNIVFAATGASYTGTSHEGVKLLFLRYFVREEGIIQGVSNAINKTSGRPSPQNEWVFRRQAIRHFNNGAHLFRLFDRIFYCVFNATRNTTTSGDSVYRGPPPLLEITCYAL